VTGRCYVLEVSFFFLTLCLVTLPLIMLLLLLVAICEKFTACLQTASMGKLIAALAI
jgi:hypothetical protein